MGVRWTLIALSAECFIQDAAKRRGVLREEVAVLALVRRHHELDTVGLGPETPGTTDLKANGRHAHHPEQCDDSV